MTEYHVLCSRPGLHRGGRANPAHAAYRQGDHTLQQLRALIDEPEIVVVIGERMTAEHLAVAEAIGKELAADALSQIETTPPSGEALAARPPDGGEVAATTPPSGKPAKTKG